MLFTASFFFRAVTTGKKAAFESSSGSKSSLSISNFLTLILNFLIKRERTFLSFKKARGPKNISKSSSESLRRSFALRYSLYNLFPSTSDSYWYLGYDVLKRLSSLFGITMLASPAKIGATILSMLFNMSIFSGSVVRITFIFSSFDAILKAFLLAGDLFWVRRFFKMTAVLAATVFLKDLLLLPSTITTL